MKRSGSLIVLSLAASGALAASAGAVTAPLQIPGLPDAKVPGQIGVALDDSWKPPVFPVPPPPNAILGYAKSTPLSSGASCEHGVWSVGVAVRPDNQPVLKGGTLRLHTPDGSLLPKMKVERHGVSGAIRWYAGPLSNTRALPAQQGIAVLPAPRWAVRDGRSLIVVRVSVGLNTFTANRANGTDADRQECYTPATLAGLGPQLRTLLRTVTVQRRPSPLS
jgi:hypothetical protein